MTDATNATDPTDSTTTPDAFIGELARGVWWLLLIRGILAIIFGILAFVSPGLTIIALAIFFGAYALVDGIFAIVHAVSNARAKKPYGWLIATGIIAIIAGLVALIFPVTAGLIGGLVLLFVIGISAIVQGISTLVRPPQMGSRVLAIVFAILEIIFGGIMVVLGFVTPASAVLSLVWVVGIWAVLIGIMLIVFSFQVKAAATPKATTTPAPAA